MNADPLFSLIEEALRKPLNGNVFEACANSVLMKALMPGRDDGVMDGAFADPNGLFPFICTTQDDVLDNFRKNIAFYRSKHNGQSKAIIATAHESPSSKSLQGCKGTRRSAIERLRRCVLFRAALP